MMDLKYYYVGSIMLYIKNNNIMVGGDNTGRDYQSNDIRDALKNQLFMMRFINAKSYSFWS